MLGKFNRPDPSKFKWFVGEYQFDRSQNFGTNITKKDIMIMRGPDAVDHTDFTDRAMQWFNQRHQPLSMDPAPFFTSIRNAGGIAEIDHDWVVYRIFGKPHKDLRSMGDANNCKDKCLGKRGRKFKVRFNTEHLRPGQQMYLAEDPSVGIKIVSRAKKYGVVFQYEAVVAELNAVVRPEFFRAGNIWIKGPAMTDLHSFRGDAGIGEMNKGFSYLRARVGIGTYKWEFEVTRKAWLADKTIKVLKCKPGTSTPIPGMQQGMIFSGALMKLKETMLKETETMLVNARYSKTLVDSRTNGEELQAPGLHQWSEMGDIRKYPPTLDGISAVFSHLKATWHDKTPYNQRHYTLQVGEGSAELIHKWIRNEWKKDCVMTLEDSMLGTSEPLENGRRGASYAPYQFTKYHFPMFGSISIKHWAWLDNHKVFDARTMPGTDYPIQSYEIHVFPSNSTNSASSGLQLVSNKHKNRDRIKVGEIAPNGYVGQDNPIWKSSDYPDLDGYIQTFNRSLGLIHFNPRLMKKFIPDIR